MTTAYQRGLMRARRQQRPAPDLHEAVGIGRAVGIGIALWAVAIAVGLAWF